MKWPVLKIIIKITIPFLDASNCEEVDEKYIKFLENVKEPSSIPIDFGKVSFISSAIGIMLYSMHESFEHRIHFMRIDKKIMTVIRMLKWDKISNYVFIESGSCPSCFAEGFDYDTYFCKKCGPFDLIELP